MRSRRRECLAVARPHVCVRGLRTDACRPTVERRTSRPLKEPNETPTSRYNVHLDGITGSPTGREPYGDRAPIVVCGWESQLPGEVGQVIRCLRGQGTRDAKRQAHPGHHPRQGQRPLHGYGSLESRMNRKVHVRFGGGRAETGPDGFHPTGHRANQPTAWFHPHRRPRGHQASQANPRCSAPLATLLRAIWPENARIVAGPRQWPGAGWTPCAVDYP